MDLDRSLWDFVNSSFSLEKAIEQNVELQRFFFALENGFRSNLNTDNFNQEVWKAFAFTGQPIYPLRTKSNINYYPGSVIDIVWILNGNIAQQDKNFDWMVQSCIVKSFHIEQMVHACKKTLSTTSEDITVQIQDDYSGQIRFPMSVRFPKFSTESMCYLYVGLKTATSVLLFHHENMEYRLVPHEEFYVQDARLYDAIKLCKLFASELDSKLFGELDALDDTARSVELPSFGDTFRELVCELLKKIWNNSNFAGLCLAIVQWACLDAKRLKSKAEDVMERWLNGEKAYHVLDPASQKLIPVLEELELDPDFYVLGQQQNPKMTSNVASNLFPYRTLFVDYEAMKKHKTQQNIAQGSVLKNPPHEVNITMHSTYQVSMKEEVRSWVFLLDCRDEITKQTTHFSFKRNPHLQSLDVKISVHDNNNVSDKPTGNDSNQNNNNNTEAKSTHGENAGASLQVQTLKQVMQVVEDAESVFRETLNMHQCAIVGHMKGLKAALANNEKSTLNEKDLYGMGALHYAVRCQQKDVLEYLLREGADANITDNSNRTPLHTACEQLDVFSCFLLLCFNAQIDARDQWNHAPFEDTPEGFQQELENCNILVHPAALLTSATTCLTVYSRTVFDGPVMVQCAGEDVELFHQSAHKIQVIIPPFQMRPSEVILSIRDTKQITHIPLKVKVNADWHAFVETHLFSLLRIEPMPLMPEDKKRSKSSMVTEGPQKKFRKHSFGQEDPEEPGMPWKLLDQHGTRMRFEDFIVWEYQWKQLCSSLDNSWRELAKRLGLKNKDLDEILQQDPSNPSKSLLIRWQTSQNAYLDFFVDTLRKMDLQAACDVVQQWIVNGVVAPKEKLQQLNFTSSHVADCIVTRGQWRQLCKILDMSNWRDLGDFLGFSRRQLDKLAREPSPSRKMLLDWQISDSARTDILVEGLKTIGNHTAAQLVEAWKNQVNRAQFDEKPTKEQLFESFLYHCKRLLDRSQLASLKLVPTIELVKEFRVVLFNSLDSTWLRYNMRRNSAFLGSQVVNNSLLGEICRICVQAFDETLEPYPMMTVKSKEGMWSSEGMLFLEFSLRGSSSGQNTVSSLKKVLGQEETIRLFPAFKTTASSHLLLQEDTNKKICFLNLYSLEVDRMDVEVDVKTNLNQMTHIQHLRLMILGDSGTGKSSFIRYMQKKKPESTESADSIIHVDTAWSEVEFDFGNYVVEAPKQKHKKSFFQVWDFTGQEAYYNTHHMFMSEIGIYIVTVDLSQKIDDNRLRFWLDSVRFYAENSPIVVIGTHADRCYNAEDIMNTLAERFQATNVVHWIAINCCEGKNVLEVRKLVAKLATRLSDQTMCKLGWLLFFDALNTQDQVFVDFNRAAEIALEFDINTRSELQEVLKFFHNMGFIQYHEEMPDIVFARPMKLLPLVKTTAAKNKDLLKAIANNQLREVEENGNLPTTIFTKIWSAYPEWQERALLLLQKFKIMFPSPTHSDFMIVPSLITLQSTNFPTKVFLKMIISAVPLLPFRNQLLMKITETNLGIQHIKLFKKGCTFLFKSVLFRLQITPGQIVIEASSSELPVIEAILNLVYQEATSFPKTSAILAAKCISCSNETLCKLHHDDETMDITLASEDLLCHNCQISNSRIRNEKLGRLLDSHSRWQQLCNLLDKGSWVPLATALGTPSETVSRLNITTQFESNFSPSFYLLNTWQDATVGAFLQKLDGINSVDAVELIQNWIERIRLS